MHSGITSVICLNVIAFWIEELHSRPLSLPEDKIPICNHSLYGGGWKAVRRRRSIPDLDAVNPGVYQGPSDGAWAERAPEEQPPPAGEGHLAPLTMEDVGALFRGRKGPAPRRGQQRPLSLARSDAAVGVQDDSGGWLPADEQDECYRQQGIEPPPAPPQQADGAQATGSRVEGWAGGSPRAMSAVDAAAQPGQQVDERARASEGSIRNVYSLYSDAQNLQNGVKVKNDDRPAPAQFPVPAPVLAGRVYKPLGVRPEFPVYDDDIDFQPDPLQGILDDKYWLEPGVREAVVRRYVDLAASNVMPPGLQVFKRNVNNVPVENNAKTAINDDAAKCPCQEVVACGSCSRGKGKKSNSTGDVADEGISYGRTLLSLANDEALEPEETDEYEGFKNRGDRMLNEDVPHHVGRKLLSFGRGEDEGYGGKEKGAVHVRKSVRSLLYYSTEDEGYYDDDADEKDEYSYQREPEGESEPWKEDLNMIMNKPYFELDESQGSLKDNKNKLHFPDYSMNDSSTLIEPRENVKLEPNPVLDMSDKAPPGFYKPNKIANILQKSFQQKAKGTRQTTVNSNREFQSVNEELFANISKYKDTETAVPTTVSALSRAIPASNNSNGTQNNTSQNYRTQPKGKSHLSQQNKKRSPLDSSINERISYSDELLDKIPHVEDEVPLFQSENAPGGVVNNNKTNTANASTTTKQTQTNGGPLTVPDTRASTTSNYTSIAATTPMPVVNLNKISKKAKLENEEAVDAEVASDIVETVLAESQRSSVLGNRLGICRRNESLTNVKYSKIVPETEKVIKTVTDCIMDKLKAHLAKQSCLLLETELLEFLKWMVLQGEPYKDYMQKVGEHSYLPTVAPTPDPTCQMPVGQDQAAEARTCEPDPMPPNPQIVSEQPV